MELIFETLQTINTYLQSNNEKEARNELNKIIGHHEENKIPLFQIL
jgi:hypothetical protein